MLTGKLIVEVQQQVICHMVKQTTAVEGAQMDKELASGFILNFPGSNTCTLVPVQVSCL